MVKSDCERKKDQRYQKKYRDAQKDEDKKKEKEVKVQNSFAESTTDHITVKQDNTKRKVLCLKCEKRFTGIGPYNRICPKCTVLNNQMKY